MSHIVVSGREFNAIVKVLKGSDFSGKLCVYEHDLYLCDPYFSMRVRLLGKDGRSQIDFFQSEASYTVTKENSAGVRVSDEVVLEEDGSWFVRTGRVSEPVPSKGALPRSVETVKSWLAQEGQEVDGARITASTMKHVVETADAFKVVGAAELRFTDRLVIGRMAGTDVRQSKALVRPKVEIDFVSTVAK